MLSPLTVIGDHRARTVMFKLHVIVFSGAKAQVGIAPQGIILLIEVEIIQSQLWY